MLKITPIAYLLLLLIYLPVYSQLTITMPFGQIKVVDPGEQEEPDSSLILIMAAEQGDFDSVKLLIDRGLDVNHTTGDGVTALMYAASNGHSDIVELLVENGAEIDAVPLNGITALAGAVRNDHYEVALYLLQNGADAGIADDRGITPLMHASSYDLFEVTELLLMFGADPDITDLEGATALHAAAIYSQPDIAWLLLEYGADINHQDDFGFTPLMMAVQLGRQEMAEYLMENGAAINLTTTDGLSTLAIAIANDRPGIAAHLIELGADPKEKISGTDNLMNLAMWQGNDELIELMQNHGVRRNIIPDFSIIKFSVNAMVNGGDYFNGVQVALEDNKYDLHVSAGWLTRPVRRAVLVEYSENWHDQLWEQRHLFYGGVAMQFPVMNYFRLNERGFYAGLKVMYSKGRYWGTYRYPKPDWHLVPSAGYFNQGSWWFYKIGYEYLQLNIIEKSAHRLTVGAGIRFSFKKDPLIYRTTYW